MKKLNINVPALTIDMVTGSQSDGLIHLEQSNGGDVARVTVHPIHVRFMAEEMGLMEASDPMARQTIVALQRRMLALNDRIVHLAHFLVNHSDYRHADLSHEQSYAQATADLAAEFCAEFEFNTSDTHPKTLAGEFACCTQGPDVCDSHLPF